MSRTEEAERLEAIAMLGRGIAHDINNLMETVLGNTALLRTGPTDDHPRIATLEAIEKAAELAGSLTQRILEITQGGARKLEPVNLNSIVYHLLLVEEQELAPRIRIVRHIEPDLWRVSAEHTSIAQVALILATNAVEAIEGEGRVTIITRNTSLDELSIPSGSGLKPGPHVLLSIEDDGRGMNAETIAKAFEPGFTTKPGKQGEGLGAAKRIVDRFGGYIAVHSFEGRGTVCRVYLPAIAESGPAPLPAPSIDAPRGAETVLVVDDEHMIREVTQETLKRLGYKTLGASNGREALDLARAYQGPIHLALLDLAMPVMGGADAFYQLKTMRPDIKVIVCTGFEQELISSHLLEADGVRSYLLKPFRLSTLAHEIRKVLDTR